MAVKPIRQQQNEWFKIPNYVRLCGCTVSYIEGKKEF